MKTRILGNSGISVTAIGLGCMGMSDFYGKSNDVDSLALLEKAVEMGVNFWDTADMYGTGHNEMLIAQVLRKHRDEITIATKFGNMRRLDGAHLGINGTPEYVKAACDMSLKRLDVDHIDLYYQHRVDPNVPIEDTVGAMAELVKAGKVRFLGLSEASAQTIRRAHAVHPITALQTEYSLWTRDPEGEILDTCRELNIAFVAYSPLGRGFLTGAVTQAEELEANDFRRSNPRWREENMKQNLALVDKVKAIASEKGCTPAQLALAWVLAQGENIIPIPGTRREKYLRDNMGALDVTLTADDLARINDALPVGAAAGTRYHETMMGRVNN
jgi:aryl-alcohol dehydrogenase-like predicted oxidoreductase